MRWYEQLAVAVEVRHLGGPRAWGVVLHYGDQMYGPADAEAVVVGRHFTIHQAHRQAQPIIDAIEAAIAPGD